MVDISAKGNHQTLNTISDIETGRKFVTAATLEHLAKAFDIPEYELLKPETVLSDKPEVVFYKFGEGLMNAFEKYRTGFLKKMK